MTAPKLRIPLGVKPGQLAKHDADGRQITVPITQQVFEERTVCVGDIVILVGANGSGKSSILQSLYRDARGVNLSIYMPGHRNISFRSSDYAMTSTRAQQILESVQQNARTSGRIRSQSPHEELQAHVQKLVDAENEYNFRFRREEIRLGERLSPIEAVNGILATAGLRPQLTIGIEGLRATVSGRSCTIDELSDGERAALLLSSVVTCAKTSGILFIDEPERHLNQSIARSFVSTLALARSDLSFVLATHDLMLARALKPTAIYVIHDCTPPTGDNQWLYQVEQLSESFDSELGEAASRAILGGRSRILFTEGDAGSLDEAVYGNLFPEYEIRPASGCANVLDAVRALREHKSLHYVDAHGIIDRDYRSPEEITALKDVGIHAVPASAIESLFCLEPVLQSAAKIMESTLGAGDAVENVRKAQDAARTEARKHIDSFVARAAEAQIRVKCESAMPKHRDIAKGGWTDITIGIADTVAKAKLTIGALVADDVSFDEMICGLPIKHSGIPATIAKSLGLSSWGAYTRLVLHNMQRRTVEGEAIRGYLLSVMPMLE